MNKIDSLTVLLKLQRMPPGGDIYIVAHVTIPEHAMEQGEYEQSMISAEQIEDILLDGQKMEYIDEVMAQETWQIASRTGK